MKRKVTLVNSGEAWDANRRYKINAIVTYNSLDWQNTTGKNSEPGVGSDWTEIISSGSAVNLQQVTNSGKDTTNDIGVAFLRLFNSATGQYSKVEYFDGAYNFYDDENNLIYVIDKNGFENFFNPNGFALNKNYNFLTIERIRIEPDKDGTYSLLSDLPQTTDDYANDAAAAIGGIAVGELYHTAGVVKIRLT